MTEEQPWPGLLSFSENDQRYFGGREDEIEALYRRIAASRLTLLFSLSGLGKSSLLRAGLFPRLRGEHYFPVYIRLRYGKDVPSPVDQIQSEIAAQARASGVEAPQPQPGETLWQYFHRADADFWDERNYPATPVLVFDQFEELFTKGRDAPEQANEVIEEIANLAEGASPKVMREAAERDPSLMRQAFDDRYRLLIGIRSDYLAQLQGISDRVRAVFSNRYELHRMSGAAALRSTLKAGGHLMDEDVARHVVRFVAGAGESNGSLSVEGLDVEPALLSLVCRELNATRLKNNEPKITASMLSGTKDEILSRFYEESFAGVAPELRVLVEDKLVSRDGKSRDFISEQTARTTPGVTDEDLSTLEDRRLLRFEGSGSSRRMELTHDLLTTVAMMGRRRRELLRKLEEADRATAEAEQREAAARRALRRSRAAALVFFVLLAVIAAQLISSFLKSRAADRAESDSAMRLAVGKLSSNDVREGLALLARAVRLDSTNSAARTLLYTQLSTRSWLVPIRAFGPEGRIAITAFSDDGSRVAFRAGKTIEMWDVATGQRVGKPLNTGYEQTRLRFASDGWTLLLDPGYANEPNEPVIWNPRSGQVMTAADVQRLPGLRGCESVSAFDLNTSTNELAASCNVKLAVIPLRGERPGEMHDTPTFNDGIRGLRFAPNPRFLVLEDNLSRQILLDRRRRAPEVPNVTSYGDDVKGLSSDGKRVVFTSGFGETPDIEVRDLESWTPVGAKISDAAEVSSIIFDPTGRTFMGATNDGEVRVWSVGEGRMLFDPIPHERPPQGIAFSPDGARFFTAAQETARWWNASSGKPVGEALVEPNMSAAHLDPRGNIVTLSNTARVWRFASAVMPPVLTDVPIDFMTVLVRGSAVDFSADRKTAIVRLYGRVLAGFDAATGKRLWTSPPDTDVLVVDSRAARALVTNGKSLSLIDTQGWKPIWTRPEEASFSEADCAFSRDGSVIVVRNSYSSTIVLSAATGNRLAPPIREPFLEINRDGSLIALISEKNLVIWNVRERRPLIEIPMIRYVEKQKIEFSPDGRSVAVVSSPEEVQVWNVADRTKRAVKPGAIEKSFGVSFSPDGRILAIRSRHGVALCDSQTIECPKELLAHEQVDDVEFSENGKRVLTASGVVQVWDVSTRRPVTLPLPWSQFAGLSPDGTSLYTVVGDELSRIPLPVIDDNDAAARLADAAEALAGIRVDRLGITAPVGGTAVLAGLEERCRKVSGPACDLVRRLRGAPDRH